MGERIRRNPRSWEVKNRKNSNSRGVQGATPRRVRNDGCGNVGKLLRTDTKIAWTISLGGQGIWEIARWASQKGGGKGVQMNGRAINKAQRSERGGGENFKTILQGGTAITDVNGRGFGPEGAILFFGGLLPTKPVAPAKRVRHTPWSTRRRCGTERRVNLGILSKATGAAEHSGQRKARCWGGK